MLKTVSKFIGLYVFSNLHIAISAAIYVLGASYFIHGTHRYDPTIALLVGMATFIVYNAHRLMGHYQLHEATGPIRIQFVRTHRRILGLVSAALLVIIISSTGTLHRPLWYIIIPALLLTTLYLLPVLPDRKRLRDLPYIKILIIAVVWAGVFLLPFLNQILRAYDTPTLALIGIEKVFFFLIITIPFDYRDKDIDQSQGTATLATSLSDRSLRNLIILCSLISLVSIILLHILGLYPMRTMIMLASTYIMSTILSIYGLSHRSELYYLGILDGMIMLNGLSYLL